MANVIYIYRSTNSPWVRILFEGADLSPAVEMRILVPGREDIVLTTLADPDKLALDGLDTVLWNFEEYAECLPLGAIAVGAFWRLPGGGLREKLPVFTIRVGDEDDYFGTDPAAVQIPGLQGYGGWSAIISNVVSGSRVVQRIDDWIGGGGDMPPVGLYISPAGLTADIADATDVGGTLSPAAQAAAEAAVQAAADTALDRTATGQDRVATGNDRSTVEGIEAEINAQPIIVSGATYALLEINKNKMHHFTNAGGCVVTLPALSYDYRAFGRRMAAGDVSWVAGAGASVLASIPAGTKVSTQYGAVQFGVVLVDAAVRWVVEGPIA